MANIANLLKECVRFVRQHDRRKMFALCRARASGAPSKKPKRTQTSGPIIAREFPRFENWGSPPSGAPPVRAGGRSAANAGPSPGPHQCPPHGPAIRARKCPARWPATAGSRPPPIAIECLSGKDGKRWFTGNAGAGVSGQHERLSGIPRKAPQRRGRMCLDPRPRNGPDKAGYVRPVAAAFGPAGG